MSDQIPSLSIEEALNAQHQGICLGAGLVLDVAATAGDTGIEKEISGVSEWLRLHYNLQTIKDEPACRAYRDFYWRMGVDPTKQRPAAEALARRILHKEAFPRINPVVDAYNLASLRSLMAIGAYDLSRLIGKLTLRLSREGEEFEPIGGEKEALKAGQIILADEKQVVHVYPYRDSKPTSVTPETKNVLVLSAGIPGILREEVLEAAELACSNIERLVGGRVERLWMVP